MALPSTGSGLALANTGTGKVTMQWVNGNPLFDDSQQEAVFSLLMEPAGWFGDSSKKRRTQIPTIKTKDASTPDKLIEYAKDALRPLIDDGRLLSVTPSVSPSGLGYLLRVDYVTGSGKRYAVTVPLSV